MTTAKSIGKWFVSAIVTFFSSMLKNFLYSLGRFQRSRLQWDPQNYNKIQNNSLDLFLQGSRKETCTDSNFGIQIFHRCSYVTCENICSESNNKPTFSNVEIFQSRLSSEVHNELLLAEMHATSGLVCCNDIIAKALCRHLGVSHLNFQFLQNIFSKSVSLKI